MGFFTDKFIAVRNNSGIKIFEINPFLYLGFLGYSLGSVIMRGKYIKMYIAPHRLQVNFQ